MHEYDRSNSTMFEYSQRSLYLRTTFYSHLITNFGTKENYTPKQLVNWFLRFTNDLSNSTFRKYKNSLGFYYERKGRKDMENAIRSLTREGFERKTKIKKKHPQRKPGK